MNRTVFLVARAVAAATENLDTEHSPPLPHPPFPQEPHAPLDPHAPPVGTLRAPISGPQLPLTQTGASADREATADEP